MKYDEYSRLKGERTHMAKLPYDWVMGPLERLMLADWLARYNGYTIVVPKLLDQLKPFGLAWDEARQRLSYVGRSAEIRVHPKHHFEQELQRHGGHGELLPGNWTGVWMLDVAAAVLSLAGVEHDPTHLLPTRSLRYTTILTILRPESEIKLADGLAGEIRE